MTRWPTPAASAASAQPSAQAPTVRVPALKLDDLVDVVGELLVARSRVASRAPELDDLHELAAGAVGEWRHAARAIRAALAQAGVAAPPALARHDEHLGRLARTLGRTAAAAGDDVRALAQAADDLADRVRRVRLRPLRDATESLPRLARDVAAAEGKSVDLVLSGGEVEADRAVVLALREALGHLVRNAVDHGIESPEARARAGKPARGSLAVRAALQGERLVVRVSDDGAGLDPDAIRAAAARAGLPVPDDEDALLDLVFTGGLSTRDQATAVSGRGVGLDAVRRALQEVRGTVRVESERGRGATFTLEAPLTLATIHAVLVGIGPHRFAVSATAVERVRRVTPDAVRWTEGRALLADEEPPVVLASLAQLLGPPLAGRPLDRAMPALVLRAGARRLAVLVDELAGELQLVVRPIDRGRQALPHLAGAAVLGDGSVALVLTPDAVVASGLGVQGPAAAPMPAAPAGARPPRRPARILVVDDSITTRTLEQGALEAAGFVVRTAVDGLDAWRMLQEETFDAVVTDVEMPRLDGLALCRRIRASADLSALPVVLLTALERPEHRAQGLEAGADVHLGKAGFDHGALVEALGRLVG